VFKGKRKADNEPVRVFKTNSNKFKQKQTKAKAKAKEGCFYLDANVFKRFLEVLLRIM